MSEQQPNQAPPEAPQQPQMTPEQLLQIVQFKQQLNTQISQLYKALCDFVRSLPVSPVMKARALQHFDDGILWVNESVRTAELEFKPVQAPVEPPKQDEPPKSDADSQPSSDNQSEAPQENV